MYTRTNGKNMGSTLGPSFCSYYMAHHEKKFFNIEDKSSIYIQHITDTFLLIEDLDHIKKN